MTRLRVTLLATLLALTTGCATSRPAPDPAAPQAHNQTQAHSASHDDGDNRQTHPHVQDREHVPTLDIPLRTIDPTLQLPAFADDRITIQQDTDEIVIRLLEEPLGFTAGSAEIGQQGVDNLRELASWLCQQHTTMRVVIEGHASSEGDPAFNDALAERRAESVAQALAGIGIPTQTRLHSRGLGTTRPVADNATLEGRVQNRRVEIRISGTATSEAASGGIPEREGCEADGSSTPITDRTSATP